MPILTDGCPDPVRFIMRVGEYSIVFGCGHHVMSVYPVKGKPHCVVWTHQQARCQHVQHDLGYVYWRVWPFETELLVSKGPGFALT